MAELSYEKPIQLYLTPMDGNMLVYLLSSLIGGCYQAQGIYDNWKYLKLASLNYKCR